VKYEQLTFTGEAYEEIKDHARRVQEYEQKKQC
jgi:hypothetical protein